MGKYKFTEYRTARRHKVYRCTNRKCKTYVTVDASLARVIKMTGHPHNHEPMSEQDVAKEVVKCAAIRRALVDQRTLPSHIVQNELDLNPDLAVNLTSDDYALIRKSVYEARRKLNDGHLSRSSDDQGSSTGQVRTGQPDTQVMMNRTIGGDFMRFFFGGG